MVRVLSPLLFLPFNYEGAFFRSGQVSPMERFITFEGIEGCGKTTQIRMAGEYLGGRRIPFISTAEPGGSALGNRIREILLNRAPYEINAEAEVFLFMAARAQHVRETILPALRENKLVLCDRFSDATLAYQGFGRGLDIDFIRKMNLFAAHSLKPALTILFDLPAEEGLKRARKRIALSGKETQAEDRFERETIEFHKKIRAGYLHLAKDDAQRFRIIDGARDIAVIHHEVCSYLNDIIEM
jgi:dTMP kinase